MKNLSFLSILFLITFPFSLYAESVTFDIAQLDFKRPEKNVGFAGNLQFRKMSLSYYDFVSEFSNSDGRFNARLFVRNNFLGLSAPQIKVGTYTHPDDILYTLEETIGRELKIVLDPKKVSVKSQYLTLKTPELHLSIEGQSSFFCQKLASTPGNTPDELEQACLHYLNFAPQDIEAAKIIFENIPQQVVNSEGEEEKGQEQSYLYFSGMVKQFELAAKRINFKAGQFVLNLDKNYLVRSAGVDFSCAKQQLKAMDSDQLLQHCLHDFHLAPTKLIAVENLTDQSSFAFFPQRLELKQQQLTLATKEFVISTPGEGDTILSRMKLSCHIDEDSDLTDVGAYISGCLTHSSMEIGSLDSNNNKDKQQGSLRKIKLSVEDGLITLKSEVKFMLKFHLFLQAQASYDAEQKILRLHVKKAILPMGIRSTRLLLYFVRKLVDSQSVKISGKDILIAL